MRIGRLVVSRRHLGKERRNVTERRSQQSFISIKAAVLWTLLTGGFGFFASQFLGQLVETDRAAALARDSIIQHLSLVDSRLSTLETKDEFTQDQLNEIQDMLKMLLRRTNPHSVRGGGQ